MALDLDLLCHCEISQSTKLGPILEVQLYKVPLIVAFTEAYRRRVPNLVVAHHPVRKRYVSVPWGICKTVCICNNIYAYTCAGVGPANATTNVTAAASGVGSAIPSNNYNTVVTTADRASV